MSRFTIHGKLPGLNEYTSECRSNKFGANKCKHDAELVVVAGMLADRPTKTAGPVNVHFDWYEPNNRRDPDNVRFAAKFILDAMVRAGIIENDSRRFVKGLSDGFHTDTKNPRIVVTIEGAE